jgi:hypothetical protein
MGEKVQIYIYDLSRGMARSLGPAIIGKHALLHLIAIKTQTDLVSYARISPVMFGKKSQLCRRVAIWLRNLYYDPFLPPRALKEFD